MLNPSSLFRSLVPWLSLLAAGVASAAPAQKKQVNPPADQAAVHLSIGELSGQHRSGGAVLA